LVWLFVFREKNKIVSNQTINYIKNIGEHWSNVGFMGETMVEAKISVGMIYAILGQVGMCKMGRLCKSFSSWVDGRVLRWFCAMRISVVII